MRPAGYVLLILLTVFASGPAHAARERPNILLFLVDDMGTQDSSEPFYYEDGQPVRTPLNERYRTPHMEQLADRGVKFTQAYACSVCTPTRVSIMTGMNAARHRVTQWTHPDQPQQCGGAVSKQLASPPWRMAGMDEQDRPLPRMLKEAGYRTIHCGKAHFGANGTYGGDPGDIGFEVNIAGHGAGGPGSYHGAHNFSAAWRKGGHMWDVPGLEAYHGRDIFLTEALTLEMNKAIEQAVADQQPFFAYMAHYAVHAPFEIDERFRSHYPDLSGKALAFATMVEGMDKSLGDLLAKLDELGVAEDTLVLFYSDNGSDGPPNLPLRGIKGMRYEGGMRVPLIAAWARTDADHPMQKHLPIPAGRIEDDLVTCYDLFPTVAEVAGIPIEHPIDGRSLLPYFSGIPGTHRPQQVLTHFPHNHRHNHFSTYREGPWKIIYNYVPGTWELYHVVDDTSEQTNLLTGEPKVAQALAGQMMRELKSKKAQFPLDKASRQAVEPDMKPIREALQAQSKSPPPPPLPGDDLNLQALAQPVRAVNLFQDKNWFTWCNSIVKGEDGTYHLFYARWPKSIGFYSWLTHSEIARAVSDHPAGPYTHVETVIPCRGTQGWNQITAHNVKVERFGDRYYLYHIGTNDGGRNLAEAEIVATAKRGYSHPNWGVLRNNQRTGVAVADRLEGPWTVSASPVVEPGGPVSTVTVNPDVWQRPDGGYAMIFKGDYPGVRIAQALAFADSPEGPFQVQPDMVYREKRTEDISTWRDPDRDLYYGLFHDMQGFGMIASRDGVHWQEAAHYRGAGKTIARADGPPLKPQRYERPFVYTEDGRPRVLGSAAKIGNDAFIVLVPLQE